MADRAAIEALGEALAGTGRPLVVASGILGVLGLPPGALATERDGLADPGSATSRSPVGRGGWTTPTTRSRSPAGACAPPSVRLPPATHGEGDNGFIPAAIGFARGKGAAAYVGDGANRWPAVHRDDAARVFRLALESAPAGSVLHAVGEEGVPIREVAEAFAAHLGVPAVSVTAEQAGEYVGFLGGFWGIDGPAANEITRDLLRWQPAHPALIADLKEGHYFA